MDILSLDERKYKSLKDSYRRWQRILRQLNAINGPKRQQQARVKRLTNRAKKYRQNFVSSLRDSQIQLQP